MILLSFVVAGLALGLAKGGSLSGLGNIPFRFSWLIPLGFVAQAIIFSPVFGSSNLSPFIPAVYLLAHFVLLVAVVLNRHLRPLWVLGLGLVLNLAVMSANGGLMPTSPEQLAISGHGQQSEKLRLEGHVLNAQLLTPETRLAFLGDILAIPAPIPLSTVFSVGDIFIGLGALVLVYKSMVAT